MQGFLMVSPLWNWNLTPEVDDSLTYVLKSRQMEECFTQNCPALQDLRQQFFVPTTDPEITRQRRLALSRVFPVYHPLFSVLLVGLSKLGMSLMEAYRFLWSLAPVIFGLAFAYFLTTLFGPAPAGIALILLAFKVLPDTGLHHLVPSNLTMALAVVLWARIISRRGWAPWSLLLGSLILITMHIVGVIYAAMAGLLALSLAEEKDRKRLWIAALAVTACIVVVLLMAHFIKKPALVLPRLFPYGDHPFQLWLEGVGQNFLQVFTENVKLEGGLWGYLPLFLGALALGFWTLAPNRRRVASRLVLINGVCLAGLVLYVSDHPADLFFRVWIPLVVLLFGLVGQAFWYMFELSLDFRRQRQDAPPEGGRFDLKHFWPVIVLFVLVGYCGHMIFRGAEQVYIVSQHLRKQQPLALSPAQPELLLAHARPGDRVLYNSIILMPYYLIHGALRLGAVYYHPAYQSSSFYADWLKRPNLRFAVAYNPTVFHPSFQGRDEHRWWVTRPEFHWSPLSKPRRHHPVAREGKIPADNYRWLDLKVMTRDFPKTLRVNLKNPGRRGVLIVVPLNQAGEPLEGHRQEAKVPAGWSGWLPVDLKAMPPVSAFRLIFPRGQDDYLLKGITFGTDRLHWPWAQKTQVTFYPRSGETEPFSVSFDPADLLPPSLRGRHITVLDDWGSSVLLQLGS